MTHYFMQFHVLGEVAEMLLLKEPEHRLLVDVSTETKEAAASVLRTYSTRTSFVIVCPHLIKVFTTEISVGDTIQATGAFSQTNYVPHKTSYIDTTFLMQEFSKVCAQTEPLQHEGQMFEPVRGTPLH